LCGHDFLRRDLLKKRESLEMREKEGRFKFSAFICGLKITKKELGLWAEMG
jgi:hypothetical protein